MLKSIFCFLICLCVFTLPSFADLTLQDLKDIRLIVKEEIEKELTPIKVDIATLKTDIATLKTDVATLKTDVATLKKGAVRLDGRITGVEKQIVFVANLVYALIALIVLAVGIPQIIMTWRSRKNSEPEMQLATLVQKQSEMISLLTAEVETLRAKMYQTLHFND